MVPQGLVPQGLVPQGLVPQGLAAVYAESLGAVKQKISLVEILRPPLVAADLSGRGGVFGSQVEPSTAGAAAEIVRGVVVEAEEIRLGWAPPRRP